MSPDLETRILLDHSTPLKSIEQNMQPVNITEKSTDSL